MIKRIITFVLLVLTGFTLLPAASFAQTTGTGTVTAEPVPTLYSAPTDSTQIFNDVDSTSRYFDAILYLKEQKVIQGYDDGSFKPDAKINRAEFVKILIAAKYPNLSGKNCFPDVRDQWFAPFVCKAKELGVIEGYPDGTFKPEQNITFAEAAKIIARTYLNYANFEQDSDLWFEVYVKALESVNDIPLSVEYFDQEITRDEMAEMIWRIKATITRASRSFDEIIGDQPYTVKTCSELEERYLDVSNRYDGGYPMPVDLPIMRDVLNTDSSGAKMESAPAAPGGGGAGDYSTTNIQVSGVDEGDIVKNDGRYIYVIKGNTVRIIDAYPAENMKELVQFDFTTSDTNFTPSDLYVDGNTLVVLGGSYIYYTYSGIQSLTASIAPMPINQSRIKAFVLDITDRTLPKVTRTAEFEGYLNTSRKVNDTLYMVMGYSQYYPYPYYGIYRPQVEDFSLYLPKMKDSVVGQDEQIVPCDQIYILPKTRHFNYLITAAIPLKNLAASVSRSVVIGNTENVYASQKNLYVASTDYSGPYFAYSQKPTTNLFRFGLSPSAISYSGYGSVPGTVLNQFSMDESGPYFRLATQEGGWDSSEISNSVYVVDLALKVVGQLNGLGKGERLYAARFLGNRAYLVSFQNIDPLFVIDMQDPAFPRLVGELKIPGYSNYLHPYDENHIIGFGQDVEVPIEGDSVTWQSIRGMKLGLFDITDPKNPKEMFSEVIGENGTYSELLYNHKALLFDKTKNLLAFPVSVTALPPDPVSCSTYNYSTCPSTCNKVCVPSSCTTSNGVRICTTDCNGPESCQQPYSYPQTVFMGAYVYELTLSGGFKLKAKISHLNDLEQADLIKNGWGNYEKAISRLLYIGNNLYSVSQAVVRANSLTNYTEIKSIDLGATTYTPVPYGVKPLY